MAGNIQKEIIESEIRASGAKQVQDDLIKVNRAIKDLTQEEKNLLFIKNKLESQGKKNTEEWKKNEAAIKSNREATARNREELTKLNGQLKISEMSYNQLSKRANELRGKLNNISKELQPEKWNRYNKELVETNAQMQKVKSGTHQTSGTFGMLTKAAGVLGIGLGSVWGAIRIGKSVIDSTESSGDKFAITVGKMTSAWDFFKKSIATGDFSNFFNNMSKAIAAGEEYAKQLDEIEDRNRSLSIGEAEANIQKQELLKILRDQTKSYEEQRAAGLKIIEIEDKLAEKRVSITTQAKDARIESLLALGVTEETIKANLVNYENNKAIIEQADEYNQLLKDRQDLQSAAGAGGSYGLSGGNQMNNKAVAQIDAQLAATSESVRKFAEMRRKFTKLSGEDLDELVQLYVEMYNAQASADENTQRVSSRLSSLIEQNTKKQQKAIDDESAADNKKNEDMLEKRKALYESFNEMVRKHQISLMTANNQELALINDKYDKEFEAFQKALDDKLISSEEFNNAQLQLEVDRTIEIAAKQSEFAAEQNKKELEKFITTEEKKRKIAEDFEKNYADFISDYREKSSTQFLKDELKKLEERHAKIIQSEQLTADQRLEIEKAYQEGKANLEKEINESITEDLVATIGGMEAIYSTLHDAVSEMRENEITNMEDDYDRRIELAGNDKDEVARLEEEKERKVKATRKKYADTAFALQVNQIIASTAQSAIEAYKALAGIPYVGPALGAAAAAAAIIYGGVQVSTAQKERQKAKSLYTGGYSGPGDKYMPSDKVQYHANEYVVASDELALPQVHSFLSNVVEPIRMRRLGYSPYAISTALPGRADGGFSGSGLSRDSSVDINEMKNLLAANYALLNQLASNGVNANFDQTKIHEMRQEISKQEAMDTRARR